MKLKIFNTLLITIILFTLSGCSNLTADTAELLTPPSLSGDISPIAAEIDKSAGGKYTLKYPSRGNYRSAVIQNDIDNDGILEAFAFYSMVDGDVTTMHINVISNKGGKWKSTAQQKIVAGGVDRLDFCDLDGDGILEILVGWEIYGTSDMQLAVYSLKDDILTQRMLQKYTHFVCSDLDEDDSNEVMIINFNSSEQINIASLFALTKDGVIEISSCNLDASVKTVGEPVVSTLSSGKPAIYVDEIKGAGAITEVLIFEKNHIVNPLYNVETNETNATLRSASFVSKDINNDAIIEIPIQENVPSISKSNLNEKLYLTNWCSFNGETLTTQMTAMMNVNDGYYYVISSKMTGKIALLKDTDNRVREIYRYDNMTMTTGEKLLYFQAVKKSDWDNGKYSGLGLEEIANDGETSFICLITEAGALNGITLQEVKSNFKLME